MKNSLTILSICLLGLLITNSFTCRKDEYCKSGNHIAIKIINQSARDIRAHFYWNYPDTSIGAYNPLGATESGIIKPGNSFDRSVGPTSCWESYLKNGTKEWIYFFDNDSLKVIPWDTIRVTGRGLLERRLISLEYLQENNFIVTYP